MAEKIVHVSTMEDGPHRSSSEQARLKLRATLNATLSIQEPVTKMHPVYESGWYRIQDQFHEIQVSIQVTIDRWPGNSQCPRQVTRKLKVPRQEDTSRRQKDTCSRSVQGPDPDTNPDRVGQYNPEHRGRGCNWPGLEFRRG